MPMNDEVIVRFIADQSNLVGAINQIASAAGRAGGAANQTQRAAAATGQMTQQSRQLTTQLRQQNRGVSDASILMKELQSQTGGFTSSFRRASMALQTGSGWLDKFSIQADRASMMVWKFSMAAVSMQGLAMTTGSVAMGFGMVTKKMLDSFSMVDRIKRQFSAIYQSAEIGGQMVDQLSNDAVKIRYTVEQVLEAGRLLAIEGFQPKELIFDMADLAAGVNQEGITIVNATRAFVDATNGQFRRLKETFQVTREDAMQFAPEAFAGPNNQITNQAKATEAIVRAIRAKYRGMNDATMETVTGLLSNVDDAMTIAAAKMGQAISGTIIGWLKNPKVLFEGIGIFADTGFGKAIANTILWTTAILAAVTGMALLAAGMVTLLGVYAGYKVWMDGKSGSLAKIIEAELQLMKITQEITLLEAQRSITDIDLMNARLALLKAIAAEDEAAIARAQTSVASFARPESRAAAAEMLALQGQTGGRVAAVESAAGGVAAATAAKAEGTKQIAEQRKIIGELATTRNVDMLSKQNKYLDALTAVQVTQAEHARDAANKALEKGHENALELVERADLAEAKALKTSEQAMQTEEKLGISQRDRARIVQDGVTLESLETRELQLQNELEVAKTRQQAAQVALQEQQVALQEAETRLIETTPHRDVREALLAGVGGGNVGGVMGGGPQNVVERSARRIERLKTLENEYLAKGMDVSNINRQADLERAMRLNERIALRERELALVVETAAAEAGGAATPAGGRFAAFTGTRFGKGFGGVFDAVVGPIKSLFAGIAGAVTGITGFGSALAVAAGALSAVALLAAPIVGTYMVLKYSHQVQLEFIKSIKDSVEALKTWNGILERPSGNQSVVDEMSSDIDALANVKRGMTDTNVYEGLMAQEGMTAKRARLIMGKVEEQAVRNQGGSAADAAAARTEWATATEQQALTNGMFNNEMLNQAMQGMSSELDSANAKIALQGARLNQNAVYWLDAQIASGKLTAETKAQYEEFKKMKDPAISVNKLLRDGFKAAADSVPDIQDITKILEDAEKPGGSDAASKAGLAANADAADKAINDMLQIQEDMVKVGLKLTAEDLKRLKVLQEQRDTARMQVGYFDQLRQLTRDMNTQGLAGAAGIKGGGGVLGGKDAAGWWAMAAQETDPKKKQEYKEKAFKAAQGQIAELEGTASDLSELGPNATPQEKAAASGRDAARKRQAQSLRDKYIWPQFMAQTRLNGAPPKELADWERIHKAEQHKAEVAGQGEERKGSDVLSTDVVARMEADRREAAAEGASNAELLDLDMDILDAKMQTAVANRDIAEQMKTQADYSELIKKNGETEMGAAEARLSLMKTMVEQGIIPEGAYRDAERQMAVMYQNMAKQAGANTAEQAGYMQKALDALAGDTKDKWDGIVGRIIGAPAELLNGVLSGSSYASRFGDIGGVLGMSRGIQADIVGQRRSSMDVRISWSDINAIDGKVQMAVQSGMNGFARDFKTALAS